jgi:hypothetical protein
MVLSILEVDSLTSDRSWQQDPTKTKWGRLLIVHLLASQRNSVLTSIEEKWAQSTYLLLMDSNRLSSIMQALSSLSQAGGVSKQPSSPSWIQVSRFRQDKLTHSGLFSLKTPPLLVEQQSTMTIWSSSLLRASTALISPL